MYAAAKEANLIGPVHTKGRDEDHHVPIFAGLSLKLRPTNQMNLIWERKEVNAVAELAWGFVEPSAPQPLPPEIRCKYQAAIKAYAEARDSDEDNGSTLGQKISKSADQV